MELTADNLRAAGVRLHPGEHFFLLSWKLGRGYFDRGGFWSDEDCDRVEALVAREEKDRREEDWKWKRVPLAEKRRIFGLMVEVESDGPRGMDKETVRARVDLVELVGQSTRLRVTGDKATGKCVFHDDRLASFSVDRKKGLFHCFGCGAAGDVFSFLMRRFEVDFKTALSIASRL